MPAPDPMFRQRLRQYHRDFLEQQKVAEPGSPAWFDLERAAAATARVHTTMFREAMEPLHNGPHPNKD